MTFSSVSYQPCRSKKPHAQASFRLVGKTFGIIKNPKIRTAERRKYIEWVNKVIGSYKGFTLKELRICFDLDKKTAQKAINNWLQFAFERRVERLELDLNIDGDWGRYFNVCTLPREKFRPQKPRSLFDSLKYLKALTLKSVDLTDQDIDVFLHSCPLLEHLVIVYAEKISSINICGDLALKHLEIRFCNKLESVKVSAPNLVSLCVSGAVPLLLEKVPKLVDVSVSSSDERVPKLVSVLFCCLSQLEILTLDLFLKKELMDKYCKYEFTELPKLKKLEITFSGKGDKSMIALTCLIRAAPFLQEFVIKLHWHGLCRASTKEKNVIHSPHQHLKVVKFLGYYGRSSDVELVRYLLDKCVVLEKLIVDPHYQHNMPHAPMDPYGIDEELAKRKQEVTVYPDEFDTLDAVRTSRIYAKKQLQGKIPHHVHLLIL